MGVVLHPVVLDLLAVLGAPDDEVMIRWVCDSLQRGWECRPEVQPCPETPPKGGTQKDDIGCVCEAAVPRLSLALFCCAPMCFRVCLS